MVTTRPLGRVDGFDRDEAECQGYEGSVVLRGLLASECDAFEALEFADGLLDACPRLVEYFRKECRSIDRMSDSDTKASTASGVLGASFSGPLVIQQFRFFFQQFRLFLRFCFCNRLA